MPNLIIGFGVAFIALWLIKQFANTSPQTYSRLIKLAGGAGGLVAALTMFLRTAKGPWALIASAALWFLNQQKTQAGAARGAGFDGFSWGGFGAKGASKARSAMVEVELDHSNGDMIGRAHSGPYAGRDFADLTRDELVGLHSLCLRQDVEGARLLEAYLDRRFPGWRPAGEGQSHAGGGGASHGAGAGGMTEDEAYDVLGLAKGASSEEITRAHRELMKKMHPDAGGSSDLAARLNIAKSVLMRRHRT